MAGHGPEPAAHTGDIGEDYNITTIVTVAVVGCLSLLVTILWLKAIFVRAERAEWERKVVNQPYAELRQLRGEQQHKLEGYDWSDPARNRVSVPVKSIEGAVLLQLQADQAHAVAAAVIPPPAAPQAEQPAAPPGPAAQAETGEPAAPPTAPAAGTAANHNS